MESTVPVPALAETPQLPVTVSFTRRADPAHAVEMTAWIRAGLTMAEAFPGFLGGGWVRPRHDAHEWHMLCRFDSPATMTAWEASPERRWWLGSAQGLAEVTRTERRTGIEGWFDAPLDAATELPASTAPPRWKQAVTIWLVFFPLNLLATVTLGALLTEAHVVLRVAVMTLTLTPVMTYLLLPWMTRRLGWWLRKDPVPLTPRKLGASLRTGPNWRDR
ncbi:MULTISPECIES: antibiotic biosynthesis monooxygenase [unclassified Modestobacter]|uniref:antibiotic biosynthesis monooxygenase n=1 Tax=unclassified Modestobacter TaxID=2643866 RepID=UPI0022AA1E75|nr:MULTISPECIES: antibiotic biosynthesis monooxygenase [unclassified Modestobacter]MCZ2825907.1 antibiotic biosynthesis monooxygenase [Modestobacter sp. VKM Ac-2981]MCZ2853028.1 antibiotic biosynthesis monooxygenase [Modestobacter sp. VKM Ac-2982]